MSTAPSPAAAPVPFHQVRLDDDFWAPRQETNRRTTLAIEYDQLKQTGRLDAFRLEWRPGQPNPPHVFWDSDTAKWIEAASYTLAHQPDPELEARLDELIAWMQQAQQPDGYLNTHFIVVEPEKRWTNLRDAHELYCAGHLIEAAVAHFQATGKRTLLEVMCRYADLIARTFGPGENQRTGVPGHEEIELALVRLYEVTGKRRYLDTAAFFVDQRGVEPNYFVEEAAARGESPEQTRARLNYWQAHCPVREQTTAEGHAVRAMYLYSGMADLARETRDQALERACRRLFENVAERRMYLTGGIGSSAGGERFTEDYDLPNESAYAETCAAVGLVFWMQRMLRLGNDGRFGDVMERALYNGTISGVSLDGKRFFYTNPLAVQRRPAASAPASQANDNLSNVRREWFGCACCPPNIARLIASVGGYFYTSTPDSLSVHLYGRSTMQTTLGRTRITVRQQTRYPWDGEITLALSPERALRFRLNLRIPGWCPRAEICVNGRRIEPVLECGYARIERVWKPGDRVEITLEMPVQRLYAHPRVRADRGRAAFQRGPIVYCFEGADNGNPVDLIAIPRGTPLKPVWKPDLLGGVIVLEGCGLRTPLPGQAAALYRPAPPEPREIPVTAVPYCTWENRARGDMAVWMRES